MFQSQTNIDLSETVIKQMKQKNVKKRPGKFLEQLVEKGSQTRGPRTSIKIKILKKY